MPKFTYQRPLPVKRTQWNGNGKDQSPFGKKKVKAVIEPKLEIKLPDPSKRL